MEVRAAHRSERDEVLDLLALWYDDREFFVRYNQNDPKFRDDLCLIARDRGAIVSTVQIFDRTINLDGHRVPMGGIGSVFTREDYRHKGVASGLMRLAVDTMVRERFEVSLLFAERLTFYNQFGWREINRKFGIVSGASSLKSPTHFEIDTFDATRDLAVIIELHRSYSGRFNVAAIRDDRDWSGNLAFAGNQPLHPGEGSDEYFVLARDTCGIAAYARVTRFHGVTAVMEYGYRDGFIDAQIALFRYLGDAAASKPAAFSIVGDHRRAALLRVGDTHSGVMLTHTAHDPLLEERLVASGASVSHHQDNNYMWRIVAPEALGSRMNRPPDAAARHAFDLFAHDQSLYWTADRF